jgi:hypothetical protein
LPQHEKVALQILLARLNRNACLIGVLTTNAHSHIGLNSLNVGLSRVFLNLPIQSGQQALIIPRLIKRRAKSESLSDRRSSFRVVSGLDFSSRDAIVGVKLGKREVVSPLGSI